MFGNKETTEPWKSGIAASERIKLIQSVELPFSCMMLLLDAIRTSNRADFVHDSAAAQNCLACRSPRIRAANTFNAVFEGNDSV